MRTSISTRVTGYFAALFLVTVAVLFFLWYFGLPGFGLTGAGGARLSEATRMLELEADHRRRLLKMAIAERRGDLLVIAENRVLSAELRDRSPQLAQDFERVADRIQRAYPDRYLELLIVSPTTGRVLLSSVAKSVGQPYPDASLVAKASRPGIKELIEQVESPSGSTAAIVRQISAPDTKGYPAGMVVGILIAVLDPQVMFGADLFLGDNQTRNLGNTVLFDSKGRTLRAAGNTRGEPVAIRLNPEVEAGFEGTVNGVDPQGKPSIQVVRHVPLTGATGWTLVHELSVDDALSGLQDNISRLAISGLVLTILALGAIALSSRRLTRPLRAMASTARRLGLGQLAVRMSRKSSDPREIDQLAHAFNEMAASLESAHRNLEAAVQTRTMELERERDRAQGYLDIAGVMLIALDPEGRIVMVNESGGRLLGYTVQKLLEMNWFAHFVPPSERHGQHELFLQLIQLKTTVPERYESNIVDARGQIRVLAWNHVISRDLAGNVLGLLSSADDITERKHLEEEMRIAAISFESQQAMFVSDFQWSILRVNQAFTQLTGYTSEEALGKVPRELLGSERQSETFYTDMVDTIASAGTWQGEVWDRSKEGRIFPVWLIVTAVKNASGQPTHYVVSMLDITERKATEDEIRNLAFYDPLTNLPNRRLLLDRLEHALAHATRHRGLGALLFVDLDNFKSLNDSMGHDTGDMLLQQVAGRLSACTRTVDTVARLGGDEFVVLLEDLSHDALEAASQAEAVAEKIIESLNRAYEIHENVHFSSPSIGITLFGEHPEKMGEPLKRADAAMYQAKAAGRNTLRFFDPQTQSAVNARLELESGLRVALQGDQFVVHYQAQVDAEGAVVGAELLLRWQHPKRGLVPPGEFIGLAEETRLIIPIGAWVLEQACRQLAQWAGQPQFDALCLSVNVSARQFHDPNFVQCVMDILNSAGARPNRLKIELTESLLVNNVEDVIVKMTALKKLGVGFSLDDFGTGYSSLSYLKRLPLDQLKIDQGFVRDILDDPNDAAIAKMVVALAGSLSLDVIAEGVETREQQDFLRGLGCTNYQGYLFSRPVRLDQFLDYVKQSGPRVNRS
ncbi:MAG: hypothetical protein RL323_560 [Pseudomonadota bacterium]